MAPYPDDASVTIAGRTYHANDTAFLDSDHDSLNPKTLAQAIDQACMNLRSDYYREFAYCGGQPKLLTAINKLERVLKAAVSEQ